MRKHRRRRDFGPEGGREIWECQVESRDPKVQCDQQSVTLLIQHLPTQVSWRHGCRDVDSPFHRM